MGLRASVVRAFRALCGTPTQIHRSMEATPSWFYYRLPSD